MKTGRKILFTLALSACWSPNLVQAQIQDHGAGNGGDICEDRFKIVRDDIRLWIEKGGAQALKPPSGTDLANYNNDMLSMISRSTIDCNDSVIKIGDEEKTCENYVDAQGFEHIVCNRQRFSETSDDDQYILVHHEYAGLAGLEVNSGTQSEYQISNQITGFLETRMTTSLVVKPVGTSPAVACASRFVLRGDRKRIGDGIARGPKIAIAAGSKSGARFYVENPGRSEFSYDVDLLDSGFVGIIINLGKPGSSAFYQANSSGLATNNSVVTTTVGTVTSQRADTKKCKIGWFEVACAANATIADDILDKRYKGAPNLENLPRDCTL